MEGMCAVAGEVNGMAVIELILKGLEAHGTLTLKEARRVITYSLLCRYQHILARGWSRRSAQRPGVESR